MDNILQKILEVKSGNKFLRYITERVKRTSYRGTHRSQHNRYDIDKLKAILKAIQAVVGEGELLIPNGDTGKDPNKLQKIKYEHPDFYQIYESLKSRNIISAPDPLRKNFFVDFSRLGFIDKYDNNRDRLDPSKRTYTKFIKLSQEGLALLKARNLFEEYRIFTRGVERLLGDALTKLVSCIDLSEYRRDRFSFEEYTLIFSDCRLDGEEKINILNEWRSLERCEQKEVLSLIRNYCNPKKFSGDKSGKKDYGNWLNETQQLMSLFKTTIYFEVDFDNRRFWLNTSEEYGVFEPSRSDSVKREYFKHHGIEREKYYELHHIVPLSYVNNKEEYKLIDNYRNLVYLHKDKHNEIKKNHIRFRHNDPKIYFEDRTNNTDKVTAKNGENAKFNTSLLNRMKRYNSDILKSIYP